VRGGPASANPAARAPNPDTSISSTQRFDYLPFGNLFQPLLSSAL
jgi:hypothetical protein